MMKNEVIVINLNEGGVARMSNDNSVTLAAGSILFVELKSDVGKLSPDSKWYVVLDGLSLQIQDFKFEIPMSMLTRDNMEFSIVENDGALMPKMWNVEPIRINKVLLIGKMVDEVYPDVIKALYNELSFLKEVILLQSAEIEEIKTNGEIL